MPKNIVFIVADQLGAGVLNCYGGGVASTPTLDALDQEGMRFDRCYATHPVCAPNRATFLTGRSLQIHGIISNNFALQTDTPTYAHLLKQHGYRTGGFGKFHQSPMSLPVPDSLAYLGVDVSTRPSRLAQYRNMPVYDGRKQYFGRAGVQTSLPFQMSGGPPVYPAT